MPSRVMVCPAVRSVLQLGADFTVVEGAGGWRVPLSGEESLSDLATALDLPVILVVGVRLGCINHAVLSAEAIQRDGLQLAGFEVTPTGRFWVTPEAGRDSIRIRYSHWPSIPTTSTQSFAVSTGRFLSSG